MRAHGTASCAGPDLTRYRDAVADLLIEMASHTGPEDLAKAEKVLTERLADAEFAPVLADRKSTRLNSSHLKLSRMPSSA